MKYLGYIGIWLGFIGLIAILITHVPSSATDMPTPTALPISTATASPEITPYPDLGIMPTPTMPYPPMLNGVPIDQIIVIDEDAKTTIRAIYAVGQVLGRNPFAFSKLGDSTIENPHFLARFDDARLGNVTYHLGEYAYLQAVIRFYEGSFNRQGEAVIRGLHAWSVFNPQWASPNCLADEGVLACEIRVHNPSIIFIRLGTNDVGVPEGFDRDMRRIIEYCLSQGVIPILGTKADLRDGNPSPNNATIRRLADEYNIPLWDFERLAQTLPNRGLDLDNHHLTTFYAHDWTSPLAWQRGHAAHSLSALIMLDAVWRVLLGY